MALSLGSALRNPQHVWGRGWEGTRDGTRQGQDSPVSGIGGGKMVLFKGCVREGPRKRDEDAQSRQSMNS